MRESDGFNFGNFYGSYTIVEEFNGLGIEIGLMDLEDTDGLRIGKTFSIVFKVSHFMFSIGYVLEDRFKF